MQAKLIKQPTWVMNTIDDDRLIWLSIGDIFATVYLMLPIS